VELQCKLPKYVTESNDNDELINKNKSQNEVQSELEQKKLKFSKNVTE